MATHASAEKAARQAIKRRARNTAAISKMKTSVKKLRTALTAKHGSKDEAKKTLHGLLNDAQRVLKKAASKNIIKRETASRQVARLSSAVAKALN